MNFILFLIIGAIAGWLAGRIMKGRGFGIIGNLIVGIIGAFIGGFVFSLLGIATYGLIGFIDFISCRCHNIVVDNRSG